MSTCHIFIYAGIGLISMGSCRMSTPASGMEDALSQAGNHRDEWFRVIRHYQDGNDTLKLQAALFLIENMTDKFYFTGKIIDEYETFIDSVYRIRQAEYDIPAIYDEFRTKAKHLTQEPDVCRDIRTLPADFLIEHIEEAFAVWNRPWNRHLSFDEFCELILPYRIGTEIPEAWRQSYRERFDPLLKSDSIRTARQACTAINNELIRLPIHIATTSALPINLRPGILKNIKFGLCGDYAYLAVYAMRAAGIPVAIESVPHWGNENGAHVFNVVYDNDSTFHDFLGAEKNPDEHLIQFHNTFPKVYRKTFGKQKKSLAMRHGNEDIPPFFRNAYMTDVTANYAFIGAKNITIPLPDRTKRTFAYLCVFDPGGWTPVAWGKVTENKAVFPAIGPNIVYHAALYAGGKLTLTGDPFLLDTMGQIVYYTPRPETIDCVLERKNPEAKNLAFLPPSMKGGRFQGADNPEFEHPVTWHIITEEPDFKYTTVVPESKTPVKYVRYQASDKTQGNMAEVEFYAADASRPLKGKIIGRYKPSIYYPRNGAEKLFDGDPLTFFHSSDTQSWGGLELERPAVISTIRYIIRNDDNGIRKGHEYELFYMDKGRWKSLGKQTATEDDRLLYEQIPEGALYWLRDYTKGREERIFEIKDHTVIWH